MDNIEQKIKINSVKSGLILGVILLALSIFSYYFITVIAKSAMLFVAGPIFFSFIIPIVAVSFFCFNERKKIGGYWTFKQATTGIFIMFFIAYLIQLVGKDFVFDKYIEPNYVQKTQDAAINAKTAILKQQHYSQALIDKNIGDLKKDFTAQSNVTIGNVIQGVAISIIFIFLFALIFGSLFKKEPPVYATQVTEE
jgi:hypothetical protein